LAEIRRAELSLPTKNPNLEVSITKAKVQEAKLPISENF
jgi:hypothetical protein